MKLGVASFFICALTFRYIIITKNARLKFFWNS